MTLLRIYASITETPRRCRWALIGHGRDPVTGEGELVELPRQADRVQLVIPAEQALITRARVPRQARRRAGAVLAFAVEEQTLGEPDGNQVNWLGAVENTANDEGLLAVVDKLALRRWRDALAAVGIGDYELHCETLLLPRESAEWSIAWNGLEGFVRSGDMEGAATDRGDRDSPPLTLRLMLEEAEARGARPNSIALYTTRPDATPDAAAWRHSLGVPLRLAGSWDWRAAPPDAGAGLARERQRWRIFAGLAARMRPAAMILGGALAIHACALAIDWARLAREQRSLRRDMETQFRAAFPDAVAVVDPALQMRRRLAEARHGAGLTDESDFLPMIEKVAAEMNDLPAGSLRAVSYENGRLTLEIAAIEEAVAQRIVRRLLQAGFSIDAAPALMRAGSGAASSGGARGLTIIARPA